LLLEKTDTRALASLRRLDEAWLHGPVRLRVDIA
jgi:hypothetical protein